MISHLSAFIFYTLAMVGILLVGFVVYKKFTPISKTENKGLIKVLDTLPIGPKKVLMVVRIRNERFLIASGAEHTTFLSKLSEEGFPKAKPTNTQNDTQNMTKAWSDIQQGANNVQVENLDKFKNIIQAQIVEPVQIQKQTEENNNFSNLKLQKLQQKFKELYEQKEEVQEIQPAQTTQTNKQKILKELLKELNNENVGIESKF